MNLSPEARANSTETDVPSRADTHARRPAIDSLTSLRGLAALWVVLYHFQSDIVTLLPLSRSLVPFFNEGHFAVPIFFVLSGYVLTYNYLESIGVRISRSKLFRFWGRRLLRIYPLHLATLLAVLAMVIVARSSGLTISKTGYSPRDFLLNLLLIHAWVPHFQLNWNYPSWSISSEWFAYLFFPLACLVLVRTRRPTLLAALGLGSYALMIGFMLAGERLPFREMTAVVGPFLLGCTFARAIALGHVPRFGLRGAAWLLLLGLILLPFLASGRLLWTALMTTGAALVFALAASGERCSRFWVWKPLIVLGETSYSLYLVHTIVQKLVYEIAPVARFADRSLPVRLLVLGGYAAAIALATWIAYLGIEVYSRKVLRRRFSL
ncbi:MAG: acyltransferase [Isosphaeraceae bacterium]